MTKTLLDVTVDKAVVPEYQALGLDGTLVEVLAGVIKAQGLTHMMTVSQPDTGVEG